MLVEERTAIRVEEITTSDALESLEPEWEQLWRSCPLATPFQSPQWLITWWRHFGGGELWTFGFRSEQRLVGLAPLYIARSPQSEARTVLLLGMGLSDYLDILAEPGFEISVVSALSSHLAENTSRWEVCDFQELRASSLLLQMSLQKGWRDETRVQSICPVLPLIGGRKCNSKTHAR